MREAEVTEDVTVVEDSGGSSPMMVEQGFLDLRSDRSIAQVVLVVAEAVPSWLLLTPLIGCRTLVVHVTNPVAWFTPPPLGFAEVRHAPSLISAVGVLANFDSSHSLILVQGSLGFVLGTIDQLQSLAPGIKFIALATGRRSRVVSKLRKYNPPLSSGSFSHSDIGGVTKSNLNLIFNFPSVSTVRAELNRKINRRLDSVIKVDLRCFASSRPPSDCNDAGTDVLDTNFCPTPLQLTKQFRVPCVYKSTGWGIRYLSPSEIGAAIDLPPGLLPALESSVANRGFQMEGLLALPPVKGLQFALTVCYGVGLDPTGTPRGSPKVSYPVSSSSPVKGLAFEANFQQALAARHTKAVKADDAEVEVDMWNEAAMGRLHQPFDEGVHGPLFEWLRSLILRQFKVSALRSFVQFMVVEHGWLSDSSCGPTTSDFAADYAAGVEALNRVGKSSFWNWDDGSSILFWRWPKEIRKECRDGCSIYIKGPLPRFTKKQRMPPSPDDAAKVAAKLKTVRDKRYISEGLVKSLTSFFAVPKGDTDIRIVYDLSACGLNEALWAPSFWMPSVDNVLDVSTHSSWFSDIDAGEMFLNYKMDSRVQPYAGVDVSWSQEGKALRWERWNRMAMGLVSSPFATTRIFAWAMEIIKGDRFDPANPFAWDKVILNLPGSESYDTSMPRVYKFNSLLGVISSDCKTFMDDSRGIGATRELCHEATHRVETLMSYLGLQDAARKRRPNSQTPGEWTGSITLALEGVGLFVTVSQKKWDKCKTIISSLLELYSSPKDLPMMDLKDLERKTGFLVHLAMAYPAMMPFLRGLYLTMNSWRSMRDGDGWKLTRRAYDVYMSQSRRAGQSLDPEIQVTDEEEGAPTQVKAVPRLYGQLLALKLIFAGDEPGLRLIRGASILELLYIFGDASGSGFGSSWNDGFGLGFRFGVWGEEGDGTSSNFRELRNLVETLESLGLEGKLAGKEIFIFTDNMVSESVASAGSSSSEQLYDLVVRLVGCLGMRFRCSVHFIHVAGSRMIAQGSDGLSRGDLYEGVMSGKSLLSFIPLAESAVERSPALLPWVQGWASSLEADVEFLDPEGWFERGHDMSGGVKNVDGIWIPSYRPGTFVWTPPPAAARIATEELRQARQKRQLSAHVVIVPRLMWVEWRKQIFKSADLIFDLPAGCEIWEKDMHETLIFALYFPYLSRAPWELRKSPLLVALERRLRQVFKTDYRLGGCLLSQFCRFSRGLESMPVRELRRVLRGKPDAVLPGQPGSW